MNTDAGTGASDEAAQKPSESAAVAEKATAERSDWSDLGARVASSLVLVAFGLGAALSGGPWLAAATGAATVAMSYEWARMSEPNALVPAFAFALAGALGAVLIASWGALGWAMAWLAACALVSCFRRRTLVGIVETAGGAIYIGAPCAVFLWLRDRSGEGLETILSLFIIIWTTDVFAYFGGKLIGGPKIARGLSPNKTWSGIASGALAGGAAGYACALLFAPSPAMAPAWVLIGLVIGFAGLMGDLFESFLKRRFGVKDASRIIPGHGGVLDRIDGLMAATLLTGAAVAFNPHVTALLIGARP